MRDWGAKSIKAVIRFASPGSGIDLNRSQSVSSEDIISDEVRCVVGAAHHIHAMLRAVGERVVVNVRRLPRSLVSEPYPDLAINDQIPVARNVGGIENQYAESGSRVGRGTVAVNVPELVAEDFSVMATVVRQHAAAVYVDGRDIFGIVVEDSIRAIQGIAKPCQAMKTETTVVVDVVCPEARRRGRLKARWNNAAAECAVQTLVRDFVAVDLDPLARPDNDRANGLLALSLDRNAVAVLELVTVDDQVFNRASLKSRPVQSFKQDSGPRRVPCESVVGDRQPLHGA